MGQGGGEAVLDGKGKWHASSRLYIRERLLAASSPLPQSEKDSVEAFVWGLVSADEVASSSLFFFITLGLELSETKVYEP